MKRITMIMLILVFALCGCGTGKSDEKLDWRTDGIGGILPVPDSEFGAVSLETDNVLRAHIEQYSEKQYKDYINKCKEVGFNVDVKESDREFTASNKDGDEVTVSYRSRKEIMKILLTMNK